MGAEYCYLQQAWIVELGPHDKILHCPLDAPGDCVYCHHYGFKEITPEDEQ